MAFLWTFCGCVSLLSHVVQMKDDEKMDYLITCLSSCFLFHSIYFRAFNEHWITLVGLRRSVHSSIFLPKSYHFSGRSRRREDTDGEETSGDKPEAELPTELSARQEKLGLIEQVEFLSPCVLFGCLWLLFSRGFRDGVGTTAWQKNLPNKNACVWVVSHPFQSWIEVFTQGFWMHA